MWTIVIPWAVLCTVLILFVVPYPYFFIVCVAEVLGGIVIGRYFGD